MTRNAGTDDSDGFSKFSGWQAVGDKTIASANGLIRRANNALAKTTMEMINHNAGKRRVMLQMVIDNITKEAAYLSPDELAQLSALLNKHIEVGAQSIALANYALKMREPSLTRCVLSALLDDETKKHHPRLHALNKELKKARIFVIEA